MFAVFDAHRPHHNTLQLGVERDQHTPLIWCHSVASVSLRRHSATHAEGQLANLKSFEEIPPNGPSRTNVT